MGRRGYSQEFRRKVLDSVGSGRRVVDVARELGISSQAIYSWLRQERTSSQSDSGLTDAERIEFAVARSRVAQLEVELMAVRHRVALLEQELARSYGVTEHSEGAVRPKARLVPIPTEFEISAPLGRRKSV